MSKMDSNERDDVHLARLLKKGLFSTTEPTIADWPVTSFHSDESSSSEDIFVPTSGQPSITNEEIGQFSHSPPVRSPVQTNSPIDVQKSIPDPNPVGQSIDNMGEHITETIDENLDANVDDHVEPTDNSAPDDGVPNVNVPPTEFKQPPAKSKSEREEITTKLSQHHYEN
ncbi:uncharacterized protein E6C27_scaffold43052G001540 [Cucumis melo var. makuwa]|uniref:Envelope-like protein n=1 Tax=Cucumis melo var. makuwa TaxID=1194695 RepID=A0A5A7UGC5_CUCMM|nr:uncharacterized protein E6C27_scaffold43052G001540 [Cucumis melo var. makuwa]